MRREGRQIEYVIRQSLSTNILDSLDKRCSSSIDLNSVMMMAHIMDIVGVSLDANRNLCDTKLMDNGYQELKDEFKNLVEEVNENLRCGPHSGRKSSAKIANQLGVNPEDIRNAGGWNTEEFVFSYMDFLTPRFLKVMAGFDVDDYYFCEREREIRLLFLMNWFKLFSLGWKIMNFHPEIIKSNRY